MSIDPTQLAQPLSQLLVQALTPLIEQLPPEVVQLLLGSPIVDYRYALQQIYQTEQLGFEAVEESLNIIIQMIQQQNPTLQAIQTQTKPVTLPTPAPAGYGGGSPSDIASAVWQYSAIEASVQTQEALSRAGSLAENWSGAQIAVPVLWAPFVGATPSWASFDQGPWSPTDLQAFNLHTLIASSSTILAYANAQLPAYAWVEDSDGHVRSYFPRGSGVIYTWLITDDDLAVYRAVGSGPSVRVPPTWPGLANVALGAVHALADGMTVAGPLDGLIVKVTAVPPPTGYYGFGARKSFVHVGAVIFLDDNGEAEHSQTIGLDDQVLVPRTMEHASSAIIRLKSGTAGTVQPWTAT